MGFGFRFSGFGFQSDSVLRFVIIRGGGVRVSLKSIHFGFEDDSGFESRDSFFRVPDFG